MIKKIVVVTSTQNEVEKLASDLSSLLDEELVFQFLQTMWLQRNLSLRQWIKLYQE